jgi:hypothetical protein
MPIAGRFRKNAAARLSPYPAGLPFVARRPGVRSPTKPEEGAPVDALKVGCVAHREAFSFTLAREIGHSAETVRVKTAENTIPDRAGPPC